MISNNTVQRKKMIKRKRFTVEEDNKIKKLVKQFGENWDEIQKNFGPSREKRQLKERWQNYLNPNISPKFTDEENVMVYNLFIKIGPKWNQIAKKMGNKSASFCKNRCRIINKNLKILSSAIEKKAQNAQNTKIFPNFKQNDNDEKNEKIGIETEYSENDYLFSDDSEDVNIYESDPCFFSPYL